MDLFSSKDELKALIKEAVREVIKEESISLTAKSKELTSKQKEILELLKSGKGLKAAAQEIGVTPTRIRNVRNTLIQKGYLEPQDNEN